MIGDGEMRQYVVTMTPKQAEMLWKMPGYANTEVTEVQDDHVLEVKNGAWTLEHPLRCRVGDQRLADCPVVKAAQLSVDKDGVPGRYRVRIKDDAATKLVFLGPA